MSRKSPRLAMLAKPAPRRSPRLTENRIEARLANPTPRRSPRLALASEIKPTTQATQAAQATETVTPRRSVRIKHARKQSVLQDMKEMDDLDSDYVYSSDSEDEYDDYDYEVY